MNLLLNSSGNSIAIRPGGGNALIPSTGADCCCTGSGGAGCLWYHFAPCGSPVCAIASTGFWECLRTQPSPTDARYHASIRRCFRWDGQEGLIDFPANGQPAPRDPSISLDSCANALCSQNLCIYYVEMSPCTSSCACLGGERVFTRLGLIAPGKTTGFACGCCYCLGNGSGAVFDAANIPSGSHIATVTENDCCTCRGSTTIHDSRCIYHSPSGCCCGQILSNVDISVVYISGYNFELTNKRDCRIEQNGSGASCVFDFVSLQDGFRTVLATARIGMLCGGQTVVMNATINPLFDSITAIRFSALMNTVLGFISPNRHCDTLSSAYGPNEYSDRGTVSIRLSTSGRSGCITCGDGGAIPGALMDPGSGCGGCGSGTLPGEVPA